MTGTEDHAPGTRMEDQTRIHHAIGMPRDEDAAPVLGEVLTALDRNPTKEEPDEERHDAFDLLKGESALWP